MFQLYTCHTCNNTWQDYQSYLHHGCTSANQQTQFSQPTATLLFPGTDAKTLGEKLDKIISLLESINKEL